MKLRGESLLKKIDWQIEMTKKQKMSDRRNRLLRALAAEKRETIRKYAESAELDE